MNTKACLIVFASAFGLLIVSAIIGNILESNGTFKTLSPKATSAVMIFYFALFCVLGFFYSAAGSKVFYFCADKNRQWRALSGKMASGT